MVYTIMVWTGKILLFYVVQLYLQKLTAAYLVKRFPTFVEG